MTGSLFRSVGFLSCDSVVLVVVLVKNKEPVAAAVVGLVKLLVLKGTPKVVEQQDH